MVLGAGTRGEVWAALPPVITRGSGDGRPLPDHAAAMGEGYHPPLL